MARNIKHIAVEELADGLYQLIKQNISIAKEDLFHAMTNLLGFERTGEQITARLEEALRFMQENNAVEDDNGVIRIKE